MNIYPILTLPVVTITIRYPGTREFVACNHMRALHVFQESINSQCTWEGYRCDTYDHFNVSSSQIHSRFHGGKKYLGAFGTTMAQMSRSWKNHRNPCTCIIQSLDDYDDDDDEKKI